jgi:hypothetical protein
VWRVWELHGFFVRGDNRETNTVVKKAWAMVNCDIDEVSTRLRCDAAAFQRLAGQSIHDTEYLGGDKRDR